jgi:hypothetical protein
VSFSEWVYGTAGDCKCWSCVTEVMQPSTAFCVGVFPTVSTVQRRKLQWKEHVDIFGIMILKSESQNIANIIVFMQLVFFFSKNKLVSSMRAASVMCGFCK